MFTHAPPLQGVWWSGIQAVDTLATTNGDWPAEGVRYNLDLAHRSQLRRGSVAGAMARSFSNNWMCIQIASPETFQGPSSWRRETKRFNRTVIVSRTIRRLCPAHFSHNWSYCYYYYFITTVIIMAAMTTPTKCFFFLYKSYMLPFYVFCLWFVLISCVSLLCCLYELAFGLLSNHLNNKTI